MRMPRMELVTQVRVRVRVIAESYGWVRVRV
jgi:hypothetical protein